MLLKYLTNQSEGAIIVPLKGATSMVGWGATRAESTCKWPSEPLVWGHNGRRGNLPDLTI